MKKTTINIAVIGKTGVGKSSFCNYIFNEDIFTTGTGSPVTGWKDHFKSHTVEHEDFTLNIYDSVGIEPDNYNEWQSTLQKFLLEKGPNGDGTPMQWLHATIYLINAASARLEPVELNLLDTLARQKIPTHIALTNCDNASEMQIKSIRQLILNRQPNSTITEVCSVAIKKRSGTSERYGKEETVNSFLSKLDTALRSQLIVYACNKMSAMIRHAQDHMIEKIDDSKIGLFNIIKGVIQDGDSFDIDGLLDTSDFDLDSISEQYESALDGLNSFLMDLGFASSHETSTMEVLESITDKISEDFDDIGSKMERKMNSITDAFDSDSLWEKAKAATRIATIVIDIKGFMKDMINEVFESVLSSIEKHKYPHLNI